MKTAKTSEASAEKSESSAATATPAGAPGRQFGNEQLRHLLNARRAQAKLAVSQPGDAHEAEADRIADQVMRMPDGAAEIAPTPMRIVQRAAESDSQSSVADSSVEHSIHSLPAGDPLPLAVRQYMEPRFGADFSAVRVHTGTRAHDLAASVQAKAFTFGNKVVFGAGHYAPDTDHGRHLLAHELTHTLQQRGAESRISRAPLDGTNDERVLRVRKTGEILDEDGLLLWALRSHLADSVAVAQVRGSNEFSGSSEVRKAAALALQSALKEMSLAERRKRRDQERSTARADQADLEAMRRYSQDQAQDRLHRANWLAGQGELKENILKDRANDRIDAANKVTFETWDPVGEAVTLHFDTPRAYDQHAKQQLDHIVRRAQDVQWEVGELIRLDRKVVADTLAAATPLQRAGLALPGIRLGFSDHALNAGRLAVNHAQFAIAEAAAQMGSLREGRNVSGARLNAALRALFEAKHLMNSMVWTRESDDQKTLGRLQSYSKAGDYATMVLPPPMQIALSTLKNAAVRTSRMHSVPGTEFGWGSFVWESAVNVAAMKVQGRLMGPRPSFGRALGVNLGVGQASRVIATGDLDQFTELEPLDAAIMVLGSAHASRAGARQKPADADMRPRASIPGTTPGTPSGYVPPALRPPESPPKGMKGPDAETGSAAGEIQNETKLRKRVREDSKKIARANRPGNDPKRISPKTIIRELAKRGAFRDVVTLFLGRIEQRFGLQPGTLRGVRIEVLPVSPDAEAANAQGFVDPQAPHTLVLILENLSGGARNDSVFPGRSGGVHKSPPKTATPVERAASTALHENEHIRRNPQEHTKAEELAAFTREEKFFPSGKSEADLKRHIDNEYPWLDEGDPQWFDDGHHLARPPPTRTDATGRSGRRLSIEDGDNGNGGNDGPTPTAVDQWPLGLLDGLQIEGGAIQTAAPDAITLTRPVAGKAPAPLDPHGVTTSRYGETLPAKVSPEPPAAAPAAPVRAAPAPVPPLIDFDLSKPDFTLDLDATPLPVLGTGAHKITVDEGTTALALGRSIAEFPRMYEELFILRNDIAGIAGLEGVPGKSYVLETLNPVNANGQQRPFVVRLTSGGETMTVPAIRMPKMAESSKSTVALVPGMPNPRSKGGPTALHFFGNPVTGSDGTPVMSNLEGGQVGQLSYMPRPRLKPFFMKQQSVVDLLHIGRALRDAKATIPDLQFLTSRAGDIVIADPNGRVIFGKLYPIDGATIGALLRAILERSGAKFPDVVKPPTP